MNDVYKNKGGGSLICIYWWCHCYSLHCRRKGKGSENWQNLVDGIYGRPLTEKKFRKSCSSHFRTDIFQVNGFLMSGGLPYSLPDWWPPQPTRLQLQLAAPFWMRPKISPSVISQAFHLRCGSLAHSYTKVKSLSSPKSLTHSNVLEMLPCPATNVIWWQSLPTKLGSVTQRYKFCTVPPRSPESPPSCNFYVSKHHTLTNSHLGPLNDSQQILFDNLKLFFSWQN